MLALQGSHSPGTAERQTTHRLVKQNGQLKFSTRWQLLNVLHDGRDVLAPSSAVFIEITDQHPIMSLLVSNVLCAVLRCAGLNRRLASTINVPISYRILFKCRIKIDNCGRVRLYTVGVVFVPVVAPLILTIWGRRLHGRHGQKVFVISTKVPPSM